MNPYSKNTLANLGNGFGIGGMGMDHAHKVPGGETVLNGYGEFMHQIG